MGNTGTGFAKDVRGDGWMFDMDETKYEKEGLIRSKKKKNKPKIFKFKGFNKEEKLGYANIDDFLGIQEDYGYVDPGDEEEEQDSDDDSDLPEVEEEILTGKVSPSIFMKETARFSELKPEKISIVSTHKASRGPVHNLLFFPELNEIVSHSQNMRFWRVEEGKNDNMTLTHTIPILLGTTHFIKWSEHEMIYSTGGGGITCLDVKKKRIVKEFAREKLEKKKKLSEKRCPIVRLLKLGEDHFLSVNNQGLITLYEFSTERSKTLTTFLGKKLPSMIRMVRSKQYPGWVYFNYINLETSTFQKGNYGVFLIDLKRDEVIMNFVGHEAIFALESFLNTKTGKEILVIGSSKHGVYLQQTTGEGKCRFIRQLSKNGFPTSLFCYFNRFIFVGSSLGHLNVYDVKKTYLDQRVHEGKINDIKLFYNFGIKDDDDKKKKKKKTWLIGEEEDGSSVKFFTTSNDGKISVVKLSLLKVDSKSSSSSSSSSSESEEEEESESEEESSEEEEDEDDDDEEEEESSEEEEEESEESSEEEEEEDDEEESEESSDVE